MTHWLEVSLAVNGELAEAVADVLARFAPNGVMTEQGVRFKDNDDEGTPSGPVTVRAYLTADDQLEQTRLKLEESLYYLGMIQPLPAPIYRPIADQNWMEAWKQHYKPILIGRRLVILPAWLDSPDSDRVAIKIDPGMAFGTGTHPTTQLCLELLEALYDDQSRSPRRGRNPRRGSVAKSPKGINGKSEIIDIGCGSGILSIAALKLGAGRALAVDLDPESIRNSRSNANTNSIGDELILGQGSVADILDGKFPIERAPVVVVNIIASVILRLLDAGLARLVDKNGSLILSGILEEQAQSVIETAQAKGLRLDESRRMGEWVALAMRSS